MPFGQEDELRQALVQHWSTLGKVIDAQPYMFPGRPWLTKRWDLLLQLPDGMKDLKAPPVFNLFGYTKLLSALGTAQRKHACIANPPAIPALLAMQARSEEHTSELQSR